MVMFKSHVVFCLEPMRDYSRRGAGEDRAAQLGHEEGDVQQQMTIITYVRHGQTDWNVEQRAQGQMNNPLNELGFRQAHAVGRRLSITPWDVLISSDLLRTRQTAEIITSYVKKPFVFDRRIREQYRGQIEGTVEEERIQRWGPNWRNLDLGIESRDAVRQRGVRFLNDVADRYAGKRVLVVTHGGVIIETLCGLFPGAFNRHFDVGNTSLTILSHDGGQWHRLLFNCTCHLKDETGFK